MRFLLFIFVVLLTRVGHAQSTTTIRVGQEFDTNPARLTNASSEGDFGTRLIAQVEGQGELNERWDGDTALILGARVFARQSSADTIGADYRGALSRAFSRKSTAGLATSARVRLDRSLNQDYGTARAGFFLRGGGKRVGFSLDAFSNGYVFLGQTRLAWAGPSSSVGSTFSIVEGLDLALRYSMAGQFFNSDRYSEEAGELVPDEGEARADFSHGPSAELTFSRTWLRAGAGYQFSENRSNSVGKSYVRHALNGDLILMPAQPIVIRVAGRVRWSKFEQGIVDLLYRVDDENSNSLVAALEFRVFREFIWAEVRYQYRSQSFDSGEKTTFVSHAPYVGLTFRSHSQPFSQSGK